MAFKDFPTVWVNNTPETLLDIALQYCIKNPRAFCSYDSSSNSYVLGDGILLPQEICDRLLSTCKDYCLESDFHTFINIFKDTNRTRLGWMDLSNSNINDEDIDILAKHPFIKLNIRNCSKLTDRAINSILKVGKSVLYLDIGSNKHIFYRENQEENVEELYEDALEFFENAQEETNEENQKNLSQDVPMDTVSIDPFPLATNDSSYSKEVSVISLPNLKYLAIHYVPDAKMKRVVYDVVASARCLTHLDISRCALPSDFSFILSLKHLTSLVVCDVVKIKRYINTICQITTLKNLDISTTSESPLLFSNPNQRLRIIIERLPNLEFLDISGTNLAGNRTLEKSSEVSNTHEEKMTDIPGLASRVNRPLEFLGLLNTTHEACYRHHIPAKKIAGDATEEQILIAGQMYCSRRRMIQKVLNDLFQIFRISNCNNVKLAFDIIMEAMQRHINVKNIQVSGSASLFYIVRSHYKHLFNIRMRRKIIKVLIDAMFKHFSDVTMLRNGCLTLIHFKIPQDVFFDYERLATLLLLIVSQDEQEEFVQRISVYLLNSLACQVDGIEKKLVGDRGAIKIMLQVIEKRLNRYVCDEVMESAWSTMWNVTDETPVNCQRFLEEKGMDLFLGCLNAFPQKPELLRNMMGLLGNVAEVKELRCHLMKDDYLAVFGELLRSRSDGIEVSYNAAGILAHIVSDGPEVWNNHDIKKTKREDVLQEMLYAIEKWSLVTKRNINYRSFKPILRLLTVEHTPEARYWAVWALANLTTVYPSKYCILLEEEGGLQLLDALEYDNSRLQNIIRQLAVITIRNCAMYETDKSQMNTDEDV